MDNMRYTQWDNSLQRFVVPLLYKADGGKIDLHVIEGEHYYAKNGAGDTICVGKEADIVFSEFIDRLAQYENTGYGPAEIADLGKGRHGRWKATIIEKTESLLRTGGPHCSACGEQAAWRTPYCPYCGAKMMEEKR